MNLHYNHDYHKKLQYMSLSLTSLSLFQFLSAPAAMAATSAALSPSLAAFHKFKFKSILIQVDISDSVKISLRRCVT